MTRLTIELTEDVARRLATRAREEGHAGPGEYAAALVSDALAMPAAFEPHTPEQVQAKLEQAVAGGPPRLMNEASWTALRQEVRRRHAVRAGAREDGTHGPAANSQG